jgi:hypothetical protein
MTTHTPLTAVFPAKAGIQIHPERLVGFTWAPAFAGETDEDERSRSEIIKLSRRD